MAATGITYEIFSSLMSSPWTCENFGADPEKAKSAREYMWISFLNALVLGIGFSLIAKSPFPLIGVMAVAIFFVIIYSRALKKGATSGSTGWANMPKTQGPEIVKFRPTELRYDRAT